MPAAGTGKRPAAFAVDAIGSGPAAPQKESRIAAALHSTHRPAGRRKTAPARVAFPGDGKAAGQGRWAYSVAGSSPVWRDDLRNRAPSSLRSASSPWSLPATLSRA